MPETTDYMILGYAVTAIILVVLVVYLVLKARNLQAELQMLEKMENEDRESGKNHGADGRSAPVRDSVSHV